jgi:DNA replicative helicase MCM subunit Mcm2 (Cdc46/Mcm family)
MEEEAEFKAYAAQPNLHERIFAKVAPNIFGHADIKKAVACLLFGGARKVSVTPEPRTYVRNFICKRCCITPSLCRLSCMLDSN